MAGYIGSKASVINSGVENKKVITATAGQTSFTGLTYSPNRVHVFQNGVRLVDGTDYTATDGTSLTLTVGALADDQVVVVSYSGFTVGDVVPASTGGTFSNAVTIDADGATVLTVDRATSDGTVIDVQKSGSSVGSIGVVANDRLYIATDDSANAGLAFDGDNSRIYACTSVGDTSDNTTDLGSETQRFKDLYLSGGAYLGGTGAANKLDDYEEGTWDARPSTSQTSLVLLSGWNISDNSGSYVKIGRLVICQFYFDWANTTSNSSTLFLNLPFAVNGTTTHWSGNGIELSRVDLPSGSTWATVRPENNQSYASFKGCGDQLSRVNMRFSHFGAIAGGYALGSFSYMTNA